MLLLADICSLIILRPGRGRKSDMAAIVLAREVGRVSFTCLSFSQGDAWSQIVVCYRYFGLCGNPRLSDCPAVWCVLRLFWCSDYGFSSHYNLSPPLLRRPLPPLSSPSPSFLSRPPSSHHSLDISPSFPFLLKSQAASNTGERLIADDTMSEFSRVPRSRHTRS
ncbi:hypothetical protein BaRGS_00001689 [Batillaria attramentaria]|uniref:Uncharacterized protein n=1 Tax=Batillaria attramentaria TaxID=370345 RepID=A0ABD0M6M6_9CAEN